MTHYYQVPTYKQILPFAPTKLWYIGPLKLYNSVPKKGTGVLSEEVKVGINEIRIRTANIKSDCLAFRPRKSKLQIHKTVTQWDEDWRMAQSVMCLL